MQKVTLQVIADRVGVSKYAVSRSLSGKDGVSEETRKIVQRAASELGYVAPTHLAGGKTIQLVLHDHDPVNSEVQLRIQRGIQRAAERSGYPVQLQWTHDASRIVEAARTGAGMILVGPHAPIDPGPLAGRRVPMVKVAMIDPLEPIDQVNTSSNEATAALGLKLVRYGHKRIAFLHGSRGYRGRRERFAALQFFLSVEEGIELRDLSFDDDGGFLAAFRQMQAEGFHPTALMAANDWIAVSAISDLMRIGLSVPGDISVVGYGDYAAATQTTPQLTTIRVPGEEVGAAALEMLIDRIEHRNEPPGPWRRLTIAPQIIERQSLRRL